MIEVNITALRQHLPEYLARVARGEHLRVTSRGKVVAEITPPTPDDDASSVSSTRSRLRGSVLSYDDPFTPVFDEGEWEMLR